MERNGYNCKVSHENNDLYRIYKSPWPFGQQPAILSELNCVIVVERRKLATNGSFSMPVSWVDRGGNKRRILVTEWTVLIDLIGESVILIRRLLLTLTVTLTNPIQVIFIIFLIKNPERSTNSRISCLNYAWITVIVNLT